MHDYSIQLNYLQRKRLGDFQSIRNNFEESKILTKMSVYVE